ncbi:YciI family protein [soil metagenome]
MKFLLLINTSPDIDRSQPAEEAPLDIEEWVEEMDSRGVRTFGDRLQPAESATTVRVRKGEVLVTDGPFVAGEDYLAGIDIIDCADLAEAVEIARLHPMATGGNVEIRPFWIWED